MALQYFFDSLDPITFQRLINTLLTARFGEAVRLMPLRGADGGRDAETLPPTTAYEVVLHETPFLLADLRLKPGRYVFQVKHHRTTDNPISAARSAVVADFQKELVSNAIDSNPPVNYFFLITNVPASKESISKVDEKRRELLKDRRDLYADVLWQEHVISWLDQFPKVWPAFPEIFPGSVVPVLGQIAASSTQPITRSVRLAIEAQSKRDGVVRFRQINLEQRLSKLFVDLDVYAPGLSSASINSIVTSTLMRRGSESARNYWSQDTGLSTIGVLTSETVGGAQRIILEGGPGQGKSTVSQMLSQLYRSKLLGNEQEYKAVWDTLPKARFPFRIELRVFAEWLGTKPDGSVEAFLAQMFSRDSGGGNVDVETIHTIIENQPVLLIFDGLDEVGSDDLRDVVILRVSDAISRFETDLKSDLRVVLTTRPPAIAGRADKLGGFVRAVIQPLSDTKVEDFVKHWTAVQCDDSYESERVSNSFEKRRSEKHVSALIKNPMQLSVLLHFIRLKGEAFPDRRAELYREYFRTVIDRDVEKSPQLRQHRDDIETLHEVIGFEIHSRAESDAAAASLSRKELLEVVQKWLAAEGRKTELADHLFKLGEERLGLIMVLKGEGEGARYGFDVQPIREYFAAAFINDKYEHDAHDLFQLMVPRSFWHEVALFLAGLRRANEKADLLSRAKTLDEDEKEAWRSLGRAITLQLLQEGVLTAPGHVQQDAISFLIAGLDPADPRVRSQPRGMVEAIPDLVASCDSHRPREILLQLFSDALANDDAYAIWRIFKVVQRIVAPAELQRLISQHVTRETDLQARLRLLWPAQSGLDFSPLLEDEPFLFQTPTSEYAKYWFQGALSNSSLTGLSSTPNYHELLVEQFAFQPLFANASADQSPLRPLRPYAVWLLCQNIQSLALWLAQDEIKTADTRTPDFSGLTPITKFQIEDLVFATSDAIQSIASKDAVSSSFRKLFTTLSRMLSMEGLPAWLASRCVVTLMQFARGQTVYRTEHGLFYSSRKPAKLEHLKEWRDLRRSVTPLFRAVIPDDLDRAGKTLATRILQQGLQSACPSHARIGGELKSIPGIIVQRWQDKYSAENDWIDRAPFPHYWIPELVKADPTWRSLALLRSKTISWQGPTTALTGDEMRGLLAAVQSSSDEGFATGALFASLGSKNWNVATLKVIYKMLLAAGTSFDIGGRLFRSQGRAEAPPLRISQLAQSIVKNRVKTSLSTSTAAASFLAENTVLKLSPLSAIMSKPRLIPS